MAPGLSKVIRRLQISVAALVATPSGFWPEQWLKPLDKMLSFMYGGGEKKAAERYMWIHSTHELHQQIRKKRRQQLEQILAPL